MSSHVQDRGPVVLGVSIAMIVVSSAFVALRFVSRVGIVRRVGWDDYTILLAWFIAFGFSFSICWGTRVGLGEHEVDISAANQNSLKKADYAFSVLYNPALMTTKTSILLFYLGLSKEERLFRVLSYLTLAVVNAAGVALTFLNIFQCRPVSATFQDPIPSGASCTDIVTLYLSSAPVNIITDLAILFLPIPILTGMRLPRKQKIILVITFSFGAFVAVVDVVRIAYLQNASIARLNEVGKSSGTGTRRVQDRDFSWYASLSFMWSAVEVNVGIICACVPSLKPLVSRILPSMIRDAGDDSGKSTMNSITQTQTQTHPDVPVSPTREKERLPSFVNGALHNPTLPSSTTKPMGSETDEDGGEMGFLEFLSGPEPEAPLGRSQSAATSRITNTPDAYFDFVNMKKTKNMLKLTNKQSIMPLALTTILFFLWGFAYGLLDVLNTQFQLIVHMSPGQEIGLHSAYFSGYFIGPLTIGRFILKKYGFKATFICGLVIYGCGTFVFWPSAVLTSFTAFLISNLIVGTGLATLETAANPFIVLCGPPEYGEIRLNISQGFQAIGSILSPLLAQKVFFKNLHDAPSLISVQWAYLGIALFVILLAVVFYYLPIPEATDEELDELADKRRIINQTKVWGVEVVWVTLGLAIFSQFCYVGGQETFAGQYQALIKSIKPHAHLSPFDYQTIGHTIFAAGRFLSAGLGWLLKPRWILLGLYLGTIVTSVLAMNLTGYAGITMLALEYMFMSGIFSLIFAIGLRGCGVHTKTAASLVTAAVSGGAVIPAIQHPVGNARGVQYSFSVIVAIYSFGTTFPIWLNFSRAAKNQVDPVLGGHHWTNPLKRDRRATPKRNGGTLMRRPGKRQSELPTHEHVEGPSAGPSTSTAIEKRGQAHDLAPWPSETEEILPDLAPWPT